MAENDEYAGRRSRVDDPARGGIAVTPNDTTDLVRSSRAIWVGAGGDVTVEMVRQLDKANPVTLTIPGVLGGSLLPIRVRKVLATGTTASGIVAFW